MEEAGVEVHRLEASNDDDVDQGITEKARAAASGIWSPGARRRTAEAIERTEPDVVHIHNLTATTKALTEGYDAALDP